MRNAAQKESAGRIGVTEAVLSKYVSGDREPETDVPALYRHRTAHDIRFSARNQNEEFSHPKIRRMIARNAALMTEQTNGMY